MFFYSTTPLYFHPTQPFIFSQRIYFSFECLCFSKYDIQMLLQTYKLTTGCSNLNAQHKVLCSRDERKICYIYQSKKQTSKIREGPFPEENLVISFQS